MKRIKEIVSNEHRPVSFLDFRPSFEIEGKEYYVKHGTLRNILSSLRRKRQIQIDYKTKQTFYTLPGTTFGRSKMMTPYHAGVPSSSVDNDSIYRLIQNLPLGRNALHDIHLRFNVKDIWPVLSTTFKIDSVSKDIRLPEWEIRDLSVKTTVHRTDTVSVVVGGSYHPIAVDFNGIIRLSNALTSVGERLSNLIQNPVRQQEDRMVADLFSCLCPTIWDGLL